ncbi:MAG: hypothetical protein ACRDQ5_26610 [Sciscionella sp.]
MSRKEKLFMESVEGVKADTGGAQSNGRAHDASINRIIMVGTSLWDWPLTQENSQCLVDLLRTIFESNADGQAWLREPMFMAASDQEDERRKETGPIEEIVSSLQDRETDTPGRWLKGRSGDYYKVMTRIENELEYVVNRVRSQRLTKEEAADYINSLPLRVCLTGKRTGARFEIEAPPRPYYVCMNFGCATAEGNAFCQLSISVWTNPPRSGAYGPYAEMLENDVEDSGEGDTDREPLVDVEKITDFFQRQVFAGIVRKLNAYFSAATLMIQGRPYFPPTFWALIPTDNQYLIPRMDQGSALVETTTRLLRADNVKSSVVSASEMMGEVRVFRRLIPVQGHADFPSYVLIPHFSAPRENDQKVFAEQEQVTGAVIMDLARLEVQVAAALFIADSKLTILEHYARVYSASAERAAGLWDALAMHLPMSEGATLDEVHKIIQLMHQVLLQGVVDLEYATGEINRAIVQLTEHKERIGEQLRRRLPGDPVRGWESTVGDSLLESGYLDFEHRRLREAAGNISTINRNCGELLDSMTLAFDERRARELDRLQRSNSMLSGVLTVVTLISLFDFTFDTGLVVNGALRYLPLGASWVIEALVLAWVGRQALGFKSNAQLASAEFKERYDRVRRFQRTVSTVQLARTKRIWNKTIAAGEMSQKEEQESFDRWARFDADLVTELGRIWQQIESLDSQISSISERAEDPGSIELDMKPKDELAELRSRAEIWGLQATLFTERPLYLHEYPLPGLICAFALISTRRTSFMQNPLFGDTYNAVSEVDILFTLREVGYTRRDARRFYRCLTRDQRDRRPVEEELREVNDFALRPGLAKDDRDRILRRVTNWG